MAIVRLNGIIFSGVLRGQPLIEMYYYRLVGLLGFEPFKGTMDVKLERRIKIKKYSTITMEHKLLDGTNMITAWLAPVNIIFRKDGNEEKYQCWAMQQPEDIYEDDVIEIISRDSIKSKFQVDDGSMIQVEFSEKDTKKEEKKNPGLLQRLSPGRTNQLMRG